MEHSKARVPNRMNGDRWRWGTDFIGELNICNGRGYGNSGGSWGGGGPGQLSAPIRASRVARHSGQSAVTARSRSTTLVVAPLSSLIR